MSGDRQSGHVKWFNSKKGWGFAQVSSESKDIFLHRNCLPEGVDELQEGQPISFVVETTRKGLRAINVQLG